MNEPRPCPFHTAQSCNLIPWAIGRLYAVYCGICLARGPTASTPELAVELWNVRAESEYPYESGEF